jgi:hypothetical protein
MMSTTDVLWRLAESYGVLFAMGLGSIVIVAVVMTIVWRREIRWTQAFLGVGALALIGFSLWMIRDLDLANRRTIQPEIDEKLTRLTYTANHHHRILTGSVCQPKTNGTTTVEDVQALGGEAYQITMLVGAIKEKLGSLLPSYYADER